MKKYILSSYFLLSIFLIQGQNTCYQAPSIDFDGTPIAWSYQVEDPLVDTSLCIGTVFEYQRSNLWVKPIEYDDKYIMVFGNGRNGSIINAIDKNDGSFLWQKIINHTNTFENRGFGCPHVNKLGKDSLELLGYRSYYEISTGSTNSLKSGFLNRIVLSEINGEELSYHDISTSNALYIYGLGNTYPHKIESNILHRFSCYPTSTDTIGLVCNNIYADNNSLLRYLPPYPSVYDGTPDIAELTKDADEIHLFHIDSNGDKVLYKNSYTSEVINDSVSILLFQYYSDMKFHTGMIKVDNWGNMISTEIDISEIVNGDGRFAWNENSIDQYKNKLRIHLIKTDGIPHGGYVDIDFEGNILRDGITLEIDGMIPRFHRTIDILDSEDILHVFRPIENNNLFIYREYIDGTFAKIGELLNPNEKFYVFMPIYLHQVSNGDLFIGLKTIIDSEFSDFNMGGWGSLIRIDADEIGLAVGVEDQFIVKDEIKVFPNPTTNSCTIETSTTNYPLQLLVFDLLGNRVLEKVLGSKQEKLKIRHLQEGFYTINISSLSTNQFLGNLKIIKI